MGALPILFPYGNQLTNHNTSRKEPIMGSARKTRTEVAVQFHSLGDTPREIKAKTLGNVIDHFNIEGVKTLVNGREESNRNYVLKEGDSVTAVPNIKHG
jgi:hypothetical protein